MPDRTPSEDTAPLKIVRLEGVRCAVLRVREIDDAALRRVEDVLGSFMPLAPNRASAAALWLAPGEWLLTGLSEQACSRVAATLAGLTFHLGDVTHGRCVFAVSGVAARDFLARGTSLDLHPRVFRPGCCAQSVFAQVPALLHHVSDDFFHLYFDVSHEAYVLAWFKRVSQVLPQVEMP